MRRVVVAGCRLCVEWWLNADEAALATIRRPVLLVAAAHSPPEFRQPVDALAAPLPNARTALVPGGHLIDPAASEVRAFVEEVLAEASG
jgi:pimeloyl-ACP methyl ester carboxylesterase